MTTAASPQAQPGSTARKPGPALWLSIVVMVIGTIVGVIGLSVGIDRVVQDVREIGTAVTPVTFHHRLDTGTWVVFAEGGSSALHPNDVIVTGPTGQIPTRLAPGDQNETRGSTEYSAAVEFSVHVAGNYTVAIHGPAGDPVLLSKSFGAIAHHAAVWFVTMAIGIVIGAIGLVLLIVGVSRRRSARAPAYPTQVAPAGYYSPYGGAQRPVAASPPPGWYADPEQPGKTRWWDGARWTDQTQTPPS